MLMHSQFLAGYLVFVVKRQFFVSANGMDGINRCHNEHTLSAEQVSFVFFMMQQNPPGWFLMREQSYNSQTQIYS